MDWSCIAERVSPSMNIINELIGFGCSDVVTIWFAAVSLESWMKRLSYGSRLGNLSTKTENGLTDNSKTTTWTININFCKFLCI